MGALIIVLGALVGIAGKPLLKITVCLSGTLVFLVASCLFFFTLFLNRDSEDWIGWVIFSVCLVIGCFVGLILAKLIRIGVAVLAGFGGYCLGLILYNAFMYKADNGKRIVFWIFTISCGVITGVLNLFLFNHAVILATSVAGSYLFIRGISMYAGGFPSEFEIADMIKYGQMPHMDARFYGYMAGFIVSSLICIILQYKLWGKKEIKHAYVRRY